MFRKTLCRWRGGVWGTCRAVCFFLFRMVEVAVRAARRDDCCVGNRGEAKGPKWGLYFKKKEYKN